MSCQDVILDQALVDDARLVLSSLPGWKDQEVRFEWMSGGGAHKNIRVIGDDKQCMIKLWNTTWEGLGVMPPSGVVMENTRLAGEAGLGASLLGISRAPLGMVIEFIPGKLLDVSNREGMKRLATAARKLHGSPIKFARDLNPFSDARTMFACARQLGVSMPEGFNDLVKTLDKVEHVIDLRRNDFVPCHNDLYGANVMEDAQGAVRLVDYDLAGNGDPSYELGFIATYAEMDEERIAQLCEDYYGEHSSYNCSRVALMALAADFNSLGLWTVARGASDKNADYDYEGEFVRSLTKVRRRIDHRDFGQHLRLAQR
ncbi:phosphotransferase family protein [Ectopseudomonas mendocina]|uniref:phosphotransferase family protein n=1 Tax=Ectopseudomonas mendocina TaxID=300 RepID=UPI000206E30D|nr:phosphotransferase [Pseudomonas mendocina]AEB58878.1 choline kinase involved in LPS biosynthesis-like protein [Pseudomonas mendocina NK-01]